MAVAHLQQALKSLCMNTGWCYAVFWKLKRRSRMMLTWEDGYCDNSKSSGSQVDGVFETGGNPLHYGGSGDQEGQIGLAVARMSYYVFSMGEGIIGRVAFTGKHQWIFHNIDNQPDTGVLKNQMSPEKYPDGWQNQFAAGIKTIAVIAVSQGVVQLGSTNLMTEDMKWIDHVKSIFAALQASPTVIRSDLFREGQGGNLLAYDMPLVAGTTSSAATRRTLSLQQNLPSSSYSQHIHCTTKYGVQPNTSSVSDVESVKDNSSISVINAECQGLKKVSAHPVSQVSQMEPVIQNVVLPSKQTHQALSCDKEKTCSFVNEKRTKEDMCHVSSVINTGTRSASSSLNDGCLVNMSLPAGQQNLLNEHLSSNQDLKSFNKRIAIYNMPDTIRDEGLLTVSDSSGSFYQQQVEPVKSLHMPNRQIPSSNSSSRAGFLNINAADKGIHSLTGGKVINQGIQNNVYQTQFSSFDPQFQVAAAVNEQLALKSESVSRGGDANIFNHVDTNMLDELETFIASVSREANFNWESSFPIGDELSQALGPAFKKGSVEGTVHDRKTEVTGENQLADSYLRKGELIQKWDSSYGAEPLLLPQAKTEPLLDAVVANASYSNQSISSHTDGSFSGKTVHAKDKSSLPASDKEIEPLAGLHSSCEKPFPAALSHEGVHEFHKTGMAKSSHGYQNLCMSNNSAKVLLGSWADDSQSLKSDDTLYSQSKLSQESSKVGKKRARSGDAARPRPKDRQQIQDRVRELRDIIPNGAKCSIDSLLEKTIKHMLFLQSVTVHADQLKTNGEFADNLEFSWAFNIENKEEGYPIMVKDLNQPRQKLVMIICEDKGLFLEIADAIRGLGLTILKGVMESQKDKVWAKFYVEANRDIQRVDVLVSLISTLHLNKNISSSSTTMASQSAPG